LSCPGDWPHGKLEFPLDKPVALPGDGPVELAMDVDGADLQFHWRLPGTDWQAVGPVLDASVISDEGGRGEHASFTGAFTGMAAFDTSGSAIAADFDRFAYLPMDG
jgi:xylan 1,4-beta-xylosidase